MKDGKVVCGAKTRGGGMCQKPPLNGRTRCKLHGGKSLQGPESPSWKGGAFSEALPRRMRDAYERARTDPNLISHRDLISAMDARLADLMQGIGDEPGKGAWKAVRAAFKALDAVKAGDGVGLERAKAKLRALIDAGVEEGQVWNEIYVAGKQRRQAAEAESRRIKALHSMMTVEQAMTLLARYVAIVQSVVTDPMTMLEIQRKMREEEKVINRP